MIKISFLFNLLVNIGNIPIPEQYERNDGNDNSWDDANDIF